MFRKSYNFTMSCIEGQEKYRYEFRALLSKRDYNLFYKSRYVLFGN